MPHNIWELERLDDVETLIAESSVRPVLLLKHSYTCGTSAQALDELHAHLVEHGSASVLFALVTVQTHRPISAAIAALFGIRHETPQALLIRHGTAVWHASHFRVTSDAIAAALAGQA